MCLLYGDKELTDEQINKMLDILGYNRCIKDTKNLVYFFKDDYENRT